MMKYIITILFSVLAVNLYSQTTWFSQNSGVTTALNYVSFPSEQTGYIAGNNSRILKTTNAGANWFTITNPISTDFQVIYFFNDLTGILAGTDPTNSFGGKSFKTTDGGLTWSSAIAIDGKPYGIYFVSNTVGYIYGGLLSMFLSKTVNGGNSWGNPLLTGGNDAMGTVSFANANTGVALVKNGLKFRTTDGGSNWTSFSASGPNQFYSSQFINETTGFACGKNGNFGKTTNAGLNWTYVNLLGITDSLMSLKFTSPKVGYIVGQSGTVLQTTDGSITWNPLVSPSPSTLRLITFTNAQTGYAVGDNGVIIKTISGIVTSTGNSELELPKEYSLKQNYPNPFNPSTTINYDIPKSGLVNIKVYDFMGRVVNELVNEYKSAGRYNIEFDAAKLSSGIYFYKIVTSDFIDTKRMVLIK